jgi:hypothetical protein
MMNPITSVRAADRRASARVAYPLDASCSTQSGHRSVRISDLSVSGCFIECLVMMGVGERVALRIELPSFGPIDVEGEVVYASPPAGCGVKFIDTPRSTVLVLQAAVDALLSASNQ